MRDQHLLRSGPALVLALAIVFLAAGLPVHAEDGTGYALDWWTIDGGGQTAAGENGYALSGTIGQPDSRVWTGGKYELSGGFWGGGGGAQYATYLPILLRE